MLPSQKTLRVVTTCLWYSLDHHHDNSNSDLTFKNHIYKLAISAKDVDLFRFFSTNPSTHKKPQNHTQHSQHPALSLTVITTDTTCQPDTIMSDNFSNFTFGYDYVSSSSSFPKTSVRSDGPRPFPTTLSSSSTSTWGTTIPYTSSSSSSHSSKSWTSGPTYKK